MLFVLLYKCTDVNLYAFAEYIMNIVLTSYMYLIIPDINYDTPNILILKYKL